MGEVQASSPVTHTHEYFELLANIEWIREHMKTNTPMTKMAHEIETVDEMLKQWDDGGTVFTIDCGGMGPGYEQAIQTAAIEFARGNQQEPMPRTDDEKADWKAWDEKCSKLLFGKLDDALGGITGAMFGAAKWLSWNWCFNGGPKALCDRAKADGKEDRVIQVSKYFPKAP